MKASEKAVSLIAKFEGFRSKAYKLAGEQYYTIGYGHYGKDVKATQTITEAAAKKLLAKDIAVYAKAVDSFFGDAINQNEFDALTSFSYNLGAGIFTKYNSQFKQRKYSATLLAEYIKLFNKDSRGIVLAGLNNRRNAEAKLLLTPVKASYYNGGGMYETKKKISLYTDANRLHALKQYGPGVRFNIVKVMSKRVGKTESGYYMTLNKDYIKKV